jgi:hypothetical protein
MSELKVNKISPRSGTDVTLGDSGDTFTVPSGATLDATNATVTYPAGSITDAAISSTAAIQQSKISGSPGFRNIVINGDMSIAQRSTSVASITVNGYYTCDRWTIGVSSLGTWTNTQSTDVPTGQGFATSFKLDCTTADASPAAGDLFQLNQLFEGQNLQYLKKGTANAVSLTASFWVKSTKTGTFIAELLDLDNSRQISKSYTVNTTNTWEFKTLTFAGDTTGTLNNDNGSSLVLSFWLGAGSTYSSGTLNTSWASITNANRAVGQVNIADNTANDFLITGVQLEAGTTASDFEFLPYDVNLGRCMRYYEKLIMSNIAAVGYSNSTSNAITVMTSSYIKRTSPSLTIPPAGSGAGQISFLTNAGVYPATLGSIAVFDTNITSFSLNQTGMTGAYSGAGLGVALYGADGESIGIDAEL